MVSVIIPAYNSEKYISETIESVQKQSFQDWEAIIVDDCSTDQTFLLAKKYAIRDSRIRVIKMPQNRGVAVARNVGLENASGDYIAFVDSDDLWKPDKLQKQFAFMQKNGCVLSYSDYQFFDTDNGALGKVMRCPKQMSANDILRNTAIGCLTVMVNRKRAGEFKMPLLSHTEDNCTWYQILKRTNQIALNVGEVLSLYRKGNESLTSNKFKAAKQQWGTYRNYYKFSIIKSAYFFICYSCNAIMKYFF